MGVIREFSIGGDGRQIEIMYPRIVNDLSLLATVVIVDGEFFAEITGNRHVDEYDLGTTGIETCHEFHEEIELLVQQAFVAELLDSKSSISCPISAFACFSARELRPSLDSRPRPET
jgi:hypothetical protein